jgi:hypothetical protein
MPGRPHNESRDGPRQRPVLPYPVKCWTAHAQRGPGPNPGNATLPARQGLDAEVRATRSGAEPSNTPCGGHPFVDQIGHCATRPIGGALATPTRNEGRGPALTTPTTPRSSRPSGMTSRNEGRGPTRQRRTSRADALTTEHNAQRGPGTNPATPWTGACRASRTASPNEGLGRAPGNARLRDRVLLDGQNPQ